METLEGRRLLAASISHGTLLIQGTDANDTAFLSETYFVSNGLRAEFILSFNGQSSVIPAEGVNKVRIITGLGDDTVDVGAHLFSIPAAITGGKQERNLSLPVRIDGGDGNDVLYGGIMNDTINGGAGDDQLFGDDGDDVIKGGAGSDLIEGGAGDDRLYGGDAGDAINGGEGNDRLYGGEGNDTLGEFTFPAVGGTALTDPGDDYMNGGPGDDLISGGAGDDRLIGGSGNDIIEGGTGIDTLIGGAGNDTLRGGPSFDRLAGGPGINHYFSSDDKFEIRDFKVGDQTTIDVINPPILRPPIG
jgi:Ca2+-binding RTX toxin-like protein